MRIALLLLFALLTACGSTPKADVKLLDETLRQYSSTVRWGEIEQIMAFIDPEVMKARPITSLEVERFKQIQIAGYRERAYEFIGDLRVRQVVQIEIVNRHTSQARSVVDIQEWRYDKDAERWWLMSGLPRIDR